MDDLLADWGREEGRKFIIVSDDARFWNLPFNASLVPMAFCELQSLVRKKLGRRHQINVPEDLPLLLPQYPVLFEDYVEGNRGIGNNSSGMGGRFLPCTGSRRSGLMLTPLHTATSTP